HSRGHADRQDVPPARQGHTRAAFQLSRRSLLPRISRDTGAPERGTEEAVASVRAVAAAGRREAFTQQSVLARPGEELLFVTHHAGRSCGVPKFEAPMPAESGMGASFIADAYLRASFCLA